MHDTETGLGLLLVGGGLWALVALLHQEHGWFKAFVWRIVFALWAGRLVVTALWVGWGFQADSRARTLVWLVIFCLPLVHALLIEAWLTYKAMVVADFGRLLAHVPVRTYDRRHQRVWRQKPAFNH